MAHFGIESGARVRVRVQFQCRFDTKTVLGDVLREGCTIRKDFCTITRLCETFVLTLPMEIASMMMYILSLSLLVESIIDLHDYKSEILIVLQMNFVLHAHYKITKI